MDKCTVKGITLFGKSNNSRISNFGKSKSNKNKNKKVKLRVKKLKKDIKFLKSIKN